MDINLSNS